MLAPRRNSWPEISNGSDQHADDRARRRFDRARAIGGSDQHHELVAAEARHQSSGADRATQPIGRGAQQLIADRVAERVVDLLELVEVDEQQRRVDVVGLGGEDRRGALAELDAVGQSGQRVEAREFVDAGLRELALRSRRRTARRRRRSPSAAWSG